MDLGKVYFSVKAYIVYIGILKKFNMLLIVLKKKADSLQYFKLEWQIFTRLILMFAVNLLTKYFRSLKIWVWSQVTCSCDIA